MNIQWEASDWLTYHTYIVGVSPWSKSTVTPMSLLTGSLVITVRFFNATYDFMITSTTDTDHTQWWNFRIKLWTNQGVALLWLPQSWSGHRNTLGKNFIDSTVIYTRYLSNQMYSRLYSNPTVSVILHSPGTIRWFYRRAIIPYCQLNDLSSNRWLPQLRVAL